MKLYFVFIPYKNNNNAEHYDECDHVDEHEDEDNTPTDDWTSSSQNTFFRINSYTTTLLVTILYVRVCGGHGCVGSFASFINVENY
jgi:hypothetical protein